MSSTKLTELTDLFAQLALNLKTLDPTAYSDDREVVGTGLSISNLNRSLNLVELDEGSFSRVRVLDTALSLMCFKAPQVYDTMVRFLVNTLVNVLSSSISCKPLKFQKVEYMHVGTEISRFDCAELVELCIDILQKLEGCGIPYQPLLYALVKAAESASCFDYGIGVVPILNTNSLERVKPALSMLHSHLASYLLFKDEEIPLRLLFWYLDPMILKNEVSSVLKDVISRPFICLETEFHERMEWRNVLLCLVISPAMFVETRTLLHNWFLMTGLASVLEFEIKLVSSVLDVIHRPLWWGLPMELGMKLPSSNAYFAHNHHLLRMLQGPMLCQNLLDIVHITNKIAHHSHAVDHKSPWATAMNFPSWFFFASSIIFRGKNTQDNAAIYIATAARYIAWIMEPTSESHEELLVDFLTKISESWLLQKSTGKNIKQQKPVHRTKLKKPKTHDRKDDIVPVQLWLKEFQDMYINYSRKLEHSSSQGINSKQNVLLRRLPLGILIGYFHEIDEDASQLLLHYATTGKIVTCRDFMNYYNYNEAVTGAKLIFDFTDIVESISGVLFDNEENGVDFICSVKIRSGRYLLSCVSRLLDIENGDMAFMLRDLYTRLGQWRLIGKDVFAMAKDFDNISKALSQRLASS